MRHLTLRTCAALALITVLAGCATRPAPLYSWNGYSDHVYSYLKNEASPEQQILDMEKSVHKTSGSGKILPPGFYAHLGLMYMNAGRTDQAINAWNHEKQQFPESISYIDYLINNMKKNKI